MLPLLRHLADLLVPRRCPVCGATLVEGEEALCMGCLVRLPRTGIHRRRSGELHERLMVPGLPLRHAVALFYYSRDDSFAELIRVPKYRHAPQVSRVMARMYARELLADGFFSDIDIILNIPLHFIRRLRRGYNQTLPIALGISDVTGIPAADNLRALRSHRPQTSLGAAEREHNLEGTFGLDSPRELDGKHILLVDDLVTTGATLRTALRLLHSSVPSATLSILTLGMTRYD